MFTCTKSHYHCLLNTDTPGNGLAICVQALLLPTLCLCQIRVLDAITSLVAWRKGTGVTPVVPGACADAIVRVFGTVGSRQLPQPLDRTTVVRLTTKQCLLWAFDSMWSSFSWECQRCIICHDALAAARPAA